ncbi:CHAP domain-containing protein [Magnetospirillum aberrantis SpK]|uniref:CHAP domain-containing protein n=1 Tax=Magnetospirillum aberrantis SpK TaxID=908842 RepID=A0A7C9UUH6_9PROT|nr:CHAP domain-containing protein [Magnetospirillum aberrantis SpK]
MVTIDAIDDWIPGEGVIVRKFWLLIASAAALTVAAITPASAIQCVQYAREASGINLKGDAWKWWNAASGLYDRGRNPRDGAVLVFTRQGSMRYGHVSVVTRVLSNRLVLVDHANWAPVRSSGRGAITTAVPVLDVSPKNDWTQVRVWYPPSNDFGSRVYRTEGYVYQPRDPNMARPAIHKVAVSKAAQMFPTTSQKSARHQVKPLETSRSEEAAPLVKAISAEAVVKAAIATGEIQAATNDAPDMIKVAKTVFRSGASTPANDLNSLLFN